MKQYIILWSSFLNGFNLNRFQKELSSGVFNPWTSLSQRSEELLVWFNEELSEVDITNIQNVVAAHQGFEVIDLIDINVMDASQDYNLIGFHKKEILNDVGDVCCVEYYRGFDETKDPRVSGIPEDNPFLGIAVKETRTPTRDVNGILYKINYVIDWYDSQGVIYQRKQWNKYFNFKRGYEVNKKAFSNLIDTATMYLTSQIGNTKARIFLQDLRLEVVGYEKGDRQPLLDGVANSLNTDITVEIKAALNLILNVNYS